MSITAIEALKAEILAECGAVDPTIMLIIDSGRWRVHLMPEAKPEADTASEVDDAARDAHYARHMRMYAETEAVRRVLACFAEPGLPFGRGVVLDLTLRVDDDDINTSMRHQVIEQHTNERWGKQLGWSITTKGIEMLRGDRHRGEIETLTSLTYDDLRAKLSSMSVEDAAAELGVSVALINEYRDRLGVFPSPAGARS